MLLECKKNKKCYETVYYGSDKEDEEPYITFCDVCKTQFCMNCHSNLLDDSYRNTCKKCQEIVKINLNKYVIPNLNEIIVCYLIGEDYEKTLKTEFY